MKKPSQGFTLLELIVVIVILGVLAVSATSRFASEDTFAVKVQQENLIAALTQAQQLAMAGRVVTFTIAGSPQEYAVNIGGSPVITGSFQYPSEVEDGITLLPTTLTLNYDGLGRTAQTTLSATTSGGDLLSLCVENSGYAHVGSC